MSTENSTRRGDRTPIRFVSYNISNIRKGELDPALREVSQDNLYLGVFQETKITDGVYTRVSSGYIVVATDAPSGHHSGVGVFYRYPPWFSVEYFQKI